MDYTFNENIHFSQQQCDLVLHKELGPGETFSLLYAQEIHFGQYFPSLSEDGCM